MAACPKTYHGENICEHDDENAGSGLTPSRDVSGRDFRSIVKPFLVAFAVFGLYTPAWNNCGVRKGCVKGRAVVLLHRVYCISIVIIFFWIIAEKIVRLYQERFDSFLQEGFFLIGSCQMGAIILMFLLASVQRRYKYLIDVFDVVEMNNFARLKKIAVVSVTVAILFAIMCIICTVLSMNFTQNSLTDIIMLQKSNNSFVTCIELTVFLNYFGAIYACSVGSLPTMLFCFLCFILSNRFKSINQDLRKMLTSNLDTDGLNKQLLDLRINHANVCKALLETDILFSPMLFVMFSGTMSTLCILLYLVSEGESVVMFLFGIILNCFAIALLVGFGSKVHKNVSILGYTFYL